MKCVKCGKAIPEGSRFCNYCGSKQELTCPACGAVLPEGSRFCNLCGARVEAGNANAQTQNTGRTSIDEPMPQPLLKLELEVDDEPEVFPTKDTFKDNFRADGGPQGFYTTHTPWTLEVQTRFLGDNEIIAEDTNPEHYLFNPITIKRKVDGKWQAIDKLLNIEAYVLDDAGIFACKGGVIKHISADGRSYKVGEYGDEKAIRMEYNGIILTVYTVEQLTQTAWGEHRDECGDMYEAWYNVYEVHTNKKQYLID